MRAGHAMMEHMRVLLVEDDPALASVVARGLDEEGLTTTIARTGEEALAEATHSSWDAIVLDIGLPGIDGYEVARRIRAGFATNAPKLVALSGYGSAEHRELAFAAGFDEHVAKPITIATLRRLIATA
jgi:two-component system, sensor histidine kinase